MLVFLYVMFWLLDLNKAIKLIVSYSREEWRGPKDSCRDWWLVGCFVPKCEMRVFYYVVKTGEGGERSWEI